MDFSGLEKICGDFGCLCERDYNLAHKTSMKIGGECGIYIEAISEKALAEILRSCRENGIPYFILGRGSNLLIKRFSGAVITLTGEFSEIAFENNIVTAGAGASLSAVCAKALENSLSGMECLYGIPGSVGGALFMNAGAYGGEMKDIVRSARCIDERGDIVVLDASEMELSYRKSVFSKRDVCILSVTMELCDAPRSQIKEKMDELMQKRRDKQPLEFPSCGSTFKRPQNGFAAALIEECGLKGCTVGGAQVSEKHSGFVINRGGATFSDVMALVEHIKRTVLEQKGVELECEMLIVDR